MISRLVFPSRWTQAIREHFANVPQLGFGGCLVVVSVAVSAFAGTHGALAQESPGEPGRGSGIKNPLKNVYFGEQHLHTSSSFDAFTVGVTMTWDQAYEFASVICVRVSGISVGIVEKVVASLKEIPNGICQFLLHERQNSVDLNQ